MAEEEEKQETQEAPAKCEECVEGLPLWMGTFSDLVTLLLTFFVLLLSFAKTETSKYKAALGSIRDAFGGNVQNYGEVIQPGKSPDDSPTMIDSQQPVMPFPIDFLTTDGVLDKHEVNRSSEEDLREFRATLKRYDLQESVEIHEMNEGIKVQFREKIFFAEGDTEIVKTDENVLKSLITLLRENDWVVYVQGFSAKNETSKANQEDAFSLSTRRAGVVARYLMKNGIRPEKVITVSFGDSRQDKVIGREAPENELRKINRKVEFIIRKRDLRASGNIVSQYK